MHKFAYLKYLIVKIKAIEEIFRQNRHESKNDSTVRYSCICTGIFIDLVAERTFSLAILPML